MTFHSEALSATQQELLRELGPAAADRGFRLGGGTALAVWLGHRRSVGIHDIGHVLYSLTYFDDADSERMPRLLHPLDWRTVKRSIRSWAKQIAG